MKKPKLILGSSSTARRDLLARLNVPFIISAPDIDESRLPDEKVEEMVLRLAITKAKKVALVHPDSFIIGCDQVGIVDEVILGKPLTHENAVKQLQLQSGKKITFYTGLCLLDTENNEYQSAVESYDVYVRHLTDKIIADYLKDKNVLQCAGSLQIEGLGISLVERLNGNDYTTLIGLPLIRLTDMLNKYFQFF